MSEVDKRVVQMVFDNEDFEKNIAKSQKSLENIDANITKMSKNSSPDLMGEAIAKAQLKFEALRTVVSSVTSVITNQFIGAISKAQSAVNNLTFDQINVGFGKYEEKLKSVQTIMSATHKSIVEVEDELERLNWFTDETSYNYSDMASNIGKFTSVGVDLNTATTAMMGIANWAAISGANVQQASRAMYNFSQAMGTGVMMTQDWMSIENANMATREFKETVIETAKEMYKEGRLATNVVDELGITVENFRSKLSEKWLTSDIMLEATNKYGQYAQEVKRIQDSADSFSNDVLKEYNYFVQASDVIEYLDNVKEVHKKELEDIVKTQGEASDELKKKAEELGISVEHAINIAKHGAEQDIYDLGERAFKAAQQYTTFGDVISATTDAVSTLWMNIFQTMFGNLEEAKATWTEMGGIFYDVFAQPIANLLEVMKTWSEYSGRIQLFGVGLTETGEEVESVFTNVAAAVESVVTPIKEAFFTLFPALQDTENVGKFLAYLTYQLREWTGQLELSTKRSRQVRRIFRSIFQIFEAGAIVVSSLVSGFKEILAAVLPTADELFGFLDKIGIKTEGLKDGAYSVAYVIRVVCRTIAGIISSFKQSVLDGSISDWIKKMGQAILYITYNVIQVCVDYIHSILVHFIKTATPSVEGFFGIFGTGFAFIENAVKNVFAFIQKAFKNFTSSGVGAALWGFLQSVPPAIMAFATTIGNALSSLFNFLTDLSNGITNLLNTVNSADSSGAGLMSGIITVLVLFITQLVEAYKEGKKNALMESIAGFFDGLTDALGTFQNTIRAQSLKAIGAALLEVAVAALVLAQIDPLTLAVSMTVLGGTLAALVGVIAVIAKISGAEVGVKGISAIMKTLSNIATYIITIAVVVRAMAKMKKEAIIRGLTAVGGIFIEIAAMIAVIRAVTLKMASDDMDSYLNQIDAMIAIMKTIPILSLALYPVASALKKISSLEDEQLANGVIAMGGITLMLLLILDKMEQMATGISSKKFYLTYSFYNNISKIAGAILIIAVAASLLVAAMTFISVIPGIQLLKGFTALSFIIKYMNKFMTQFASIFKSISESSAQLNIKGVVALAATMPILAGAIIALIVPMVAFAFLPLVNMLKGVAALSLVGTIMYLMMKGLESLVRTKMDNSLPYTNRMMATNMLSMAASLLLMSIAVTALMVPIYLAANYMEPLSMLQAIGGFLLVMTIVVGFIASLNGILNFSAAKTKGDSIWSLDSSANNWGGQMIKIAFGLMIMALGISILMIPIHSIGRMDPAEFGQGMLGVVGMMSAVILFIMALNTLMNFESIGGTKSGNVLFSIDKPTATFGGNLFKIAGALLVFAAGMYVLAKSIEILGTMDEQTFINGAKKMLQFIAAITLVVLVFTLISKFANNVRKVAESSKSSTKGLLTHISGLVKTIENVALAILALPIVISLLAGIDDDVFRKGILRVAMLMGMIALFFTVLELSYAALFKSSKSHSKLNNKKKDKGLISEVTTSFYSEVNEEKGHEIEDMGANIKGMASAMLTVVGAIALLIIPLSILGGLDRDVVTQGTIVIFGLMSGMAILFAAMGHLFAEHTAAQIWAMLPVIMSINAFMIAMMVLTMVIGKFAENDPGAFASGLLAVITPILLMSVAIAVLVKMTEKENKLGDVWKTMLAFAAVIVAVGGVLYLLSEAFGKDTGTRHAALDAAITLGVFVALMVGSIALLSSKAIDGTKLTKLAITFIAFGGAIALIAGSLYVLATKVPPEKLWEAAKALLVIIGAIAAVLIIVGVVNAFLPGFAAALLLTGAAFALVGIGALAFAASLYIIVHALKYLGENWTIIEDGLNNITIWLQDHADEWGGILFKFIAGVVKYAMEQLGLVGKLILGTIEAVDSAVGLSEAKLANKDRDRQAVQNGQTMENILAENGGELTPEVMERFIDNKRVYRTANLQDLKDMASWYKIGNTDEKNEKIRNEMIQAYLGAGGELYVADLERFVNKDMISDTTAITYSAAQDKLLVDTSKINTDVLNNWNDTGAAMGFTTATAYHDALADGFNPALYEQYGQNVVQGFASGSNDPIWAQLGFSNAEAYGRAIQNGLQIHSPSKRMEGDGENTVQGFANGASDKKFSAIGESNANSYSSSFQNGIDTQTTTDISTAPDAYGVLGGQAASSFNGEFFKGLVNGWDNNYFFSLGKDGISSLLDGLKSGFPSITSSFSSLSTSLGNTFNLGIFGKNEDGTKTGEGIIDKLFGAIGISSDSDLANAIKSKFSPEQLGGKLGTAIEQTVKDIGNGVDWKTALKNNMETQFGTSTDMKDLVLGVISESTGVDFSDLTGKNGLFSEFGEFNMDQLKIEMPDLQKTIDESLDFDLGKNGENAGQDYAAGIQQGMLNFETPNYNFDPASYLNDTNIDTSKFYDTGMEQATSQLSGYEDTLSNYSGKYDFSAATGSKSQSTSSTDSQSNLIWRGYGRNGEELWAPSKEDMYNNLVKPIRDGFEWHGWDAEGATPWKAVETAADAMKDAADQTALAERQIFTDANKQKWILDENAGKWVAIDENGNPITKTNMEGKEELWTQDIQKPDTKVQNGLWIWDEKNKQWIFTINGDMTPNEKGMLLTDAKAGLNGTPTLSDAQYASILKKQAAQEQKDKEKYAKLYGDLAPNEKIREFKDKDGKLMYYGGKKYTVKNKETGETKMKQDKYALRGKKLAGYDNAYALVDEKGNLIFNSRGERITFTVDKTNGVKLMSESMTQAANTMNEAGKEVQNAAKNPNTKAAMYGASTAVGNAEATKDVYSTAVVHNQDTGLVESKYNNNVVAQNQSNQQAQDATQSAKSAIDHLQEINSKMTEVRDLMISNNMMLATIEALNMNMDKSMKDASVRPFEVNIDGKKVAEATKGFMNKSLGVVSRMGGRQVAT